MSETKIDILFQVTRPRVDRNASDSARGRDVGGGFSEQLSLHSPSSSSDAIRTQRFHELPKESTGSVRETESRASSSTAARDEPIHAAETDDLGEHLDESAGRDESLNDAERDPADAAVDTPRDSAASSEKRDDSDELPTGQGRDEHDDDELERPSVGEGDGRNGVVAPILTPNESKSQNEIVADEEVAGNDAADAGENGARGDKNFADGANHSGDPVATKVSLASNVRVESAGDLATEPELDVEAAAHALSPGEPQADPEEAKPSDAEIRSGTRETTTASGGDSPTFDIATERDDGETRVGEIRVGEVPPSHTAKASSDDAEGTAGERTASAARENGEQQMNRPAPESATHTVRTPPVAGVATAAAAAGTIGSNAADNADIQGLSVAADSAGKTSTAAAESSVTIAGRRSFSIAALGAPDGTERTDGPRVDTARFVSRVTRAFHFAQERGGTLQLRLSPPELGALRLELTVREGVLSAKMEAETPAARRLLLDNLPALRERLAEQNVRVERFDVDIRRDEQDKPRNAFQQGQQHQPQDFDERRQHPSRTAGKRAPMPQAAAPTERVATSVTANTGINLVI